MEAWQKKWVVENKLEPIHNIHGNRALLAKLESFDLLAKREIQELNRTLEIKGPIEQASQLLEYLDTRINAYDLLFHALLKTSQTGAAKILQNGREHNTRQGKDTLPEVDNDDLQIAKPVAEHTHCLQNGQTNLLLHNWRKFTDEEKLKILEREIKAPKHHFWAEMHHKSLQGTTEFQHFVSKNIQRLVTKSYSNDPDTTVNLLLIIPPNNTPRYPVKP